MHISIFLSGIFSNMLYLRQNTCCAFCGKMLLSSGAATDMADKDGETALVRAAEGGHAQVEEVRSLIWIHFRETHARLLFCYIHYEYESSRKCQGDLIMCISTATCGPVCQCGNCQQERWDTVSLGAKWTIGNHYSCVTRCQQCECKFTKVWSLKYQALYFFESLLLSARSDLISRAELIPMWFITHLIILLIGP